MSAFKKVLAGMTQEELGIIVDEARVAALTGDFGVLVTMLEEYGLLELEDDDEVVELNDEPDPTDVADRAASIRARRERDEQHSLDKHMRGGW